MYLGGALSFTFDKPLTEASLKEGAKDKAAQLEIGKKNFRNNLVNELKSSGHVTIAHLMLASII